MEGFLWLLLQILPLLTAAAVVFFILGWRWRGQDTQKAAQTHAGQIDSENSDVESAWQERDTARAAEEKVRLLLAESQTEQKEAQDRQTQLQKEILRLSDSLKVAKEAIEVERQLAQSEKETVAKLQQELEVALNLPASAPAVKKKRATPATKASAKAKKAAAKVPKETKRPKSPLE